MYITSYKDCLTLIFTVLYCVSSSRPPPLWLHLLNDNTACLEGMIWELALLPVANACICGLKNEEACIENIKNHDLNKESVRGIKGLLILSGSNFMSGCYSHLWNTFTKSDMQNYYENYFRTVLFWYSRGIRKCLS